MSKTNKSFVKPGGLQKTMRDYENQKKQRIAENTSMMVKLGINSKEYELTQKGQINSNIVEKSKTSSRDDDEEYQPPLDEDRQSSSSEDEEVYMFLSQ